YLEELLESINDIGYYTFSNNLQRDVIPRILHLTRGITDLNRRMNNMVTKETLEKSFKTTGNDMIVRALKDTQKDISKMQSDVENVRNNVKEGSKSVSTLSTKVTNEILHLTRGITDLNLRMNNMVTNETLEKSFKMTGNDMIARALQGVVTTKELEKTVPNMIEKSLKTTGNAMIARALQGVVTTKELEKTVSEVTNKKLEKRYRTLLGKIRLRARVKVW
ncbi:hypothetical protein ALC60_10342, partial [Trachymyrmex zeteki]